MRHFEEIEKNIIRTLIKNEKKNGLNVLSNILVDNTIDFFNQELSFYLTINQSSNHIDMNTYNNMANISNDQLDSVRNYVNKNMLIIIDLLEYLSKNNYIVHTGGSMNNIFNMGNTIYGQTANSLSFISPSIMPNFIKWSGEQFYSTSKLIELVNNKFIDQQEKKYLDQLHLANRQIKIALGGLLITTLALGISTYFQVMDSEVKKIEIINKSLDVNNTNKILLRVDDIQLETENKIDDKQFNQLLQILQDKRMKVRL